MTNVMQNVEWDYEVGQMVHADLDESYGLPDDAQFEVVKRFLDDDIQVYELKYNVTGEIYEAYPSMISPLK